MNHLKDQDASKQDQKEFLLSLPGMEKGCKRLVIILGLLGDFDSIEYIQMLVRYLPCLEKANIKLLVIGIGSEEGKKKFCEFTKLPHNYITVVDHIDIHQKLGLNTCRMSIYSPIINLLLMCAGINSPGTLNEVLRGYVGDKNAQPIFKPDDIISTGILPDFKGKLFEGAGGKGFLRPFEMATLRLGNMTEVLFNWSQYMINNEYLSQRGGTFMLDEGNKFIHIHRSNALLSYSHNMSKPISYLEQYIKVQ
ncbi:AhpC/TSA family protein [Prochlorococcus sp. MIT 1307]|uniref:AhpC/TSA family protein n=1 Tax=Prochlorococcus sp. MIT 1307 TaxID=3096219 RepID=UPI002A74F673|nr:AhpC/TSA family protein [Prochlorococcus sp. MIT 1307]